MKNSALIKWLDKQHDQESIMIEMGLGEDGECEINKMHLEVLKRKVEDSRPKWISVTNQSPPLDTLVNICGGNIVGASSGWFAPLHSDDKTTFDVFDDDELYKFAADYWQLLPEPK